jgi:ABC-type branched-subunit amino acid transport system ATPase component
MSETNPTLAVPFIRKLHARRYGCLQDVEIDLTPLHAVIGPNDSGKTTVLRALRAALCLARGQFHAPDPLFQLLPKAGEPCKLVVEFGNGGESFKAFGHRSQMNCVFRQGGKDGFKFGLPTGERAQVVPDIPTPEIPTQEIRRALNRGEEQLRLDPDALRQPSQLIPDGQEIKVFGERGRGLAGVFDAIRNGSSDASRQIDAQMQKLFPTVKRLGLKNINESTKALRVELKTGELVEAELMSEGMLYFLAFAALQHVALPSLLLIEEPENGLHPARIRDVVRVLREISQQTQIVLATHSPLVINELEGHEVTVLTRDAVKGTIATRMDQTPNFEERSKVYALGELWVSYADGNREEPLLHPDQK